MVSNSISLNEYYDFCRNSDISPNYHPDFIDFYFAKLSRKPKIIGHFDKTGRLIAAYPVLFKLLFPNTLHKIILKKEMAKLGDIGQPEALFPVVVKKKIILKCFSPVTSPVMREKVRSLGNYSVKRVAIAKKAKHKSLTKAIKLFQAQGGEIFFTDTLHYSDFAEIYTKLINQNRGIPVEDLRNVREQILILYKYCHGCVLFKDKEPKAALLSWKFIGKTILYVQGVNYVYKLSERKKTPFGNIVMLASLRNAEELALTVEKRLRYSFGYYYGPQDYKNRWAKPESTFIGV
jgi:hypothetical protein